MRGITSISAPVSDQTDVTDSDEQPDVSEIA
jgi:hypothetical protein